LQVPDLGGILLQLRGVLLALLHVLLNQIHVIDNLLRKGAWVKNDVPYAKNGVGRRACHSEDYDRQQQCLELHDL
jgi:hypothetical protein